MSESDLREGHAGAPPDSPIDLLATHQAAASNDVVQLAELIQQGSPTLGEDTKETPLHAAAKRGALNTLRWLLDNKTVSPLIKAGNGNSAAHYAAVYGHLEALKLLIEHDPELSREVVSHVDESGLSLISLATLQGDKDMTAWLIDNHPEIGDIPNLNGDLAVHFAAAQGHMSILKLLVRRYGKDIVEKQDKNSTKPVYFASQEGQLTILDYLINELGADPVAREKSGISTVHAAVQAGRYKAVKWLISKLGNKYILDKTIDGATPLHMAAAQGHTDILRYLLDNLENIGDVNILDHIHATPAHDAAEYGQLESMLLLLKNGADISIKDTENKTPHQLAVEQNHPEVAAMIADLRDNGPSTLAKYEKKKHSSSQPVSMVQSPRTTRQEAEELSTAIKQSTHVQEQRKNQQLQRQESLQKMNERGLEEDDKAMSDEDEIEHTLGPHGDIYARPKKRKHRNKNISHHQGGGGGGERGSDEDLLDNHSSFTAAKQKNSLLDAVLPLDDSTYASVNHDTASNYSRPSRVRRYHDSDSEITSISSQYRDGRQNVPGFYPPYGGGGYYPPIPPPHKGHNSSASSLHSSKTGHSRRHGYRNHPMMHYGPYGYYPMPYPPYGYPYQHYGGQQAAAVAGHGHMMPDQPMYYYNQPMRGRRSRLKKKSRSRQPSRDPSPRGASRKHTDADMGYGPAVKNRNEVSMEGAKRKGGGASDNQSGFHPLAPPITGTDGNAQAGDSIVTFDSNFIMMKKSDTADEIKQLGGTTLNTARAPRHYDGRWDSYIMTDSESEHEVDENYCVAFAAETVAILAIGCVSGLKRLKKLRKGPLDTQPDKAYLSSAWDEPPMPHTIKGHSRRNSISGLADPTLIDVSPEDFAAREELNEQAGWAGSEKKNKRKKNKKDDKNDSGVMYRSASAEVLDIQPQSELLAGEIERHKNASVSRSFGQKMLFDALGARESSMLNIASTSLAGSRMSLNPSGEEEEDDEFNETISMVHGIKTDMKKKKNSTKQPEEDSTQTDKVARLNVVGSDESGRPRSGRKTDKQKVKEEEKTKKEREKEEKKQGRENAKKEKLKKKEDQKRLIKETKEKTKDIPNTTTATANGTTTTPKKSTTPKRPSTPKKSTPPIPVRSAPPPPRPTSSRVASREPAQQSKKLSITPPSQHRPPSASRHRHREQNQLKPGATSTPVGSKDNTNPRKNRLEKAPLKSSPIQSTRSTSSSKQKSHTVDRDVKHGNVSQLETKPPQHESTKSSLTTQRKNTYFDNESDEETEPVPTITTTAGTTGTTTAGTTGTTVTAAAMVTRRRGSSSTGQQALPSKPPKAEEEADRSIADLDAVLAELENIQTGGLMSWLEPNKVTNVDVSEESDDSLPLVVPHTATHPAARQKTKQSQRHLSPPKARAFGAPQTRPEDSHQQKDDTNVTTTTNDGGSPQQKSGGNEGVRSNSDSQESNELFDAASLQRTKHGSPYPGRRGGSKKDLDSASSSSGSRRNKAPAHNSVDVKQTFELQKVSEHATDGGGRSENQRSTFEQNVMSTLEALNESMNQLKENPSISQTELTEHTQLQQQLIQNLATYSQHDPHLVNKLIALLTDKGVDGMETSSSDQLEQLQKRILGAHERTYQETQEHFRTQEALQRAIQHTLEEQTQQQMKGMQANFEMFSKQMEEQLRQQRQKFEEELKKRELEDQEEEQEVKEKKKRKGKSKKKDRKKKHKHYSDSDSGSSASEDEGGVMTRQKVSLPAVKTMEAKIFTQELLEDATPPKQSKGRMRRPSDVELFRTTEALNRNLPLEDEEDEEMFFQHARPVTIRRADIKVQSQDDYTPQRPNQTSEELRGQSHQDYTQTVSSTSRPLPKDEGHFEDFHMLKARPPKQLKTPEKKQEFNEKDLRYGKKHVEVDERQKPVEEVHPLAGAGGELAAALKLRQKQIKNRERK